MTTRSNITLQLKRHSSLGWSSNTDILGLGELAFETDTRYIKIGDGSNIYRDISYAGISNNTRAEDYIGAQGILGDTGYQGVLGATGAQGLRGTQGNQGDTGHTGLIGLTGMVARDPR